MPQSWGLANVVEGEAGANVEAEHFFLEYLGAGLGEGLFISQLFNQQKTRLSD